MTFKTISIGDTSRCGQSCPLAVQAEGPIGKETAKEFVEFIQAESSNKNLKSVVFINSPGGVLEGAIRLGFIFRTLKITVAVAQAAQSGDGSVSSAQCYSACVYALMGGKKRVVPTSSRIGIHAIFTNKFEFDPMHVEPPYRKIVAPADVNDVARKYTKYMGVSTDLVNLSETVSPNAISILTPSQISKFRLGIQSLK